MTKADLVEEVTRVTELPRKESEAVVETIFESIIAALAGRRQDRNSRLRQLPHAPAARPHRAKSEDRRESGSPAEEDPLLQAQQGTEGLRQQPAALRARGSRHAGLSRMDYLWTPWRYRYIADASKDDGCIFCDALAAKDDAEDSDRSARREKFRHPESLIPTPAVT